MLSNYHSLAGKAAGLLALLGFIPYTFAMFKGKNRPNRATWIIWTVVGIVLLTSYRAAGATHTLWTSVANVFCLGIIVLLSLKYGEGGWNWFDRLCLFGAALGLGLWWVLDSPLPALYLSLLIDLIGALPTLKKVNQDPASEDHLTWIFFWAANTLNLFAIESWTLPIALYPLYLFGISGAILLLITLRKRQIL